MGRDLSQRSRRAQDRMDLSFGLAMSLEEPMSDRTYRITEVVGTSTVGVDDAIRNAVSRASRTLRHLDWFEVTQVRGHIVDDQVEHVQVGLKLGFRLEDNE